MIDVKAARARIAGWRGAFEEKLAAFVEIPTVSMDPARRPEMDRCVAAAQAALGELGARVDVIETGGFPLVLGRVTRDPSYPTVTIYTHLDVQPADAAEWKSPPFTFTRQGDRYVARGSTDDKGPALTALYGAKLARETDARVNVQFLWELEEEIGSPNFARGLGSAMTAAGFATESVVVSDTIWTAAGTPSIRARWSPSWRSPRSRCTASWAATAARASRRSSLTAPRPSCRRAWCPTRTRRRCSG